MGYIDPSEIESGEQKGMSYLTRLFDLFIDRIIAFTDYFIIAKSVTLSEFAVFAFCLTRVIWLCFVDVVQPYEVVFTNTVWLCVYSLIAAIHFTSYFLSTKVRAFAVCFHAFIWCFLFGLASYAQVKSFAVPGLLVLTFLSIFVAVRLFRANEE